MRIIDCAGKSLDLSRPRVMGILNVTPDSFSDGGRFLSPEVAISRAREMIQEGADIVDVGGESTRPGAKPVSVAEEVARVLPIVRTIAETFAVPVSIDTSKPEVMREAVAAGASMINDVMALRAPDALQTAADLGVPVCLMHMQGRPGTMQREPSYSNVVDEVAAFLDERVAACEAAGIDRQRLIIDPGFGFGKSLDHNLSLLKNLRRFADTGLPLLVGISRKSMIGMILNGAPEHQRLVGSISAAVLAMESGASILRVHDVKATMEAVRVVSAVRAAH